MSDRGLYGTQLDIVGFLRRAADDWVETWLIAKTCNTTHGGAAANLRELRQAGVVVNRRSSGYGHSEWSLRR